MIKSRGLKVGAIIAAVVAGLAICPGGSDDTTLRNGAEVVRSVSMVSILYGGDTPHYVKIGDNYFPVLEGQRAGTQLGLVDNSLKGFGGYNPNTLGKIISKLNGVEYLIVGDGGAYRGIGEKLSEEEVSNLEETIGDYSVVGLN